MSMESPATPRRTGSTGKERSSTGKRAFPPRRRRPWKKGLKGSWPAPRRPARRSLQPLWLTMDGSPFRVSFLHPNGKARVERRAPAKEDRARPRLEKVRGVFLPDDPSHRKRQEALSLRGPPG